MSTLRGSIKFLIFLFVVGVFLTVSFIGQLFVRDLKRRRTLFSELVHLTCRFGVWFLNLQLIIKNKPEPGRNYLFVGNHLGILDVIIMASIRPTLFVTSVEMQKTPGLGLLCEMGGCLFVERRNRSNIHQEIDEIREALKQSFSITLYPEGTSTNGEKVLPFKKSLLVAAAGTGVPIKPMVINYRQVNGHPMSHEWRDHVFWYGDQTFPPILWRLLQLRSCVAELEFLDEIEVHSDEQRREVAVRAQQLIEARFTPIPVPKSNTEGSAI